MTAKKPKEDVLFASSKDIEQQANETPIPVKLAAAKLAKAGTLHFAVLMDFDGRPVQTMLVNNLPQEILVELDGEGRGPCVGPDEGCCVFRLVSVDRYNGRTIPGLARYIQYQGRIPASWHPTTLGRF